MSSIAHITLALSGVFQAAELVRQVARRGLVDQAPFEHSINSVLTLDAETVEEVYGGLSGIKLGLQTLIGYFGGGGQYREAETIRYAVGVMILERKLNRRQDMLEAIGNGVQRINEQIENHTVTHSNMLEQMAQLYSRSLSTLDYRIQVLGEPHYLDNQDNADKIRSLLLAGVRSAVLWRQKGGGRWQLMLYRNRILKTARQYLEQIEVVDRISQPKE